MSMRLWRIEDLEQALIDKGCKQISGWNDRVCGRWWALPDGRWFLVPFPEEPDENGNSGNPLKCRYPGFVVDDIFGMLGFDPLP